MDEREVVDDVCVGASLRNGLRGVVWGWLECGRANNSLEAATSTIQPIIPVSVNLLDCNGIGTHSVISKSSTR
jgi:hypothetical protein